ncbi:SDR family oxidoreductase [Paraburkholderia xenovorans]|uniref:UDP-glucose 4-epimerase family protein n=1 Tax=Paraburkholderia xenovorans TaxID=36873 RepID=UPI0038BC37BF
MSHVLVSGANGFVGRALCPALLAAGHAVTGVVRRAGHISGGVSEWVDASIDFAGIDAQWPSSLKVDCVVHLAARVHVMRDDAADPDAAFHATNVEGTLRLARAARNHGARRFVFVSSVKAQAEEDNGRPLREDDEPAPEDAYGRSKLAAERALSAYSDESGLDVVIVRPPLVYGPEVRANFLRLMEGVAHRVPLPLGMVDSRRSMVYVGNLVDALMHCALDPLAARQTFNVADSEVLSVTELVRALMRHLQKSSLLLPVPPAWLRIAGLLTGRRAQVERLVGSLELDTTRIHTVLGWQPPFSTEKGLAETTRWYRSTH